MEYKCKRARNSTPALLMDENMMGKRDANRPQWRNIEGEVVEFVAV